MNEIDSGAHDDLDVGGGAMVGARLYCGTMNLHRLDLVSLSLFSLVARTGSISKGAELARLAVGAASKRISDLEAAVNSELLKAKVMVLGTSAAKRSPKATVNDFCPVWISVLFIVALPNWPSSTFAPTAWSNELPQAERASKDTETRRGNVCFIAYSIT